MTGLSIIIAIFGTIISFHLHMIATFLSDIRDDLDIVITEEENDD